MSRHQSHEPGNGPGRDRERIRERGSASVEAAVGVPAFLLLIGLILLAARVTVMSQAVQAVAADAARAASIARTAEQAQAAAAHAAGAGVTAQGLDCLTVQVSADTTGFAAPVGTPAVVTATVTCRVDLTGIDLPGLGEREVTATMVSPLDTYRGRT